MNFIALLLIASQIVTVSTKPVSKQAVQFHADHVVLVNVPSDGYSFPRYYAAMRSGYEGELPQQILTCLFKYDHRDTSDREWGLWTDDARGEEYTGTTAQLHDGDWIVIDNNYTVVYTKEAFERTFTR
jgi:hypothetical protein